MNEQTELDQKILQEKHDLKSVIQKLLVIGVLLSSALMLIGFILGIVQGVVVPSQVPNITAVPAEVLALHPIGFMALGLLVLIATPIVRVFFSVWGFLYEHDWRYALVTLIVFIIVLTSIFLGRE